MDDLDITLAVRKQMELRTAAEHDPQADPSLYTPWSILGPDDYVKHGISEKAV
jgi:hypothetical protein